MTALPSGDQGLGISGDQGISAEFAGPARPGVGPGEITPDGCAVELYRRLPPDGEAELVHAAVPAGAVVLDLGCGVGRVAGPLVALGHRVVGVDESPAMLALVPAGVEPIRSRIEDLRWEQWIRAARLEVATLDGELGVAGLRRAGWLTADGTWFAAAPA